MNVYSFQQTQDAKIHLFIFGVLVRFVVATTNALDHRTCVLRSVLVTVIARLLVRSAAVITSATAAITFAVPNVPVTVTALHPAIPAVVTTSATEYPTLFASIDGLYGSRICNLTHTRNVSPIKISSAH